MLNIGINGRSIFRQLTGVQQYAREITFSLCSLDQPDVNFTVFSGREARGGNEPDLPLRSSFFPADSPLKGMLWEQTLLGRMAKKAGVDLLFSPANIAPLYTQVPGVVTIHDLAFLLFPGFFSRSFARYYREAIPRVARRSVAVITDSTSTKNDLEEHLGIPAEKIHVVPLGVSHRFRERIDAEKLERVRRRFCLPDSFFLSISSIEPRKNLGKLIHAYRLLPPEIREVHGLVLTGTGGKVYSDPGIAGEIALVDSGHVSVTGYVDFEDLVALYRLATALVYPSLYEGFGLPVLEAMAAATPVITSNRSSLPEVAGHAAVLIDPESVEELAGSMELVASDSGTRNLLIERGKKRASEFTWKRTAEKTLTVLREAATGLRV